MSLLSLPLRIPLLPLTSLVKLAELIEEEAERQLDVAVRRQLEEAEEARLSGQVSEDEIARVEEQAVRRLIGSQHDGTGPRGRWPNEQ